MFSASRHHMCLSSSGAWAALQEILHILCIRPLYCHYTYHLFAHVYIVTYCCQIWRPILSRYLGLLKGYSSCTRMSSHGLMYMVDDHARSSVCMCVWVCVHVCVRACVCVHVHACVCTCVCFYHCRLDYETLHLVYQINSCTHMHHTHITCAYMSM